MAILMEDLLVLPLLLALGRAAAPLAPLAPLALLAVRAEAAAERRGGDAWPCFTASSHDFKGVPLNEGFKVDPRLMVYSGKSHLNDGLNYKWGVPSKGVSQNGWFIYEKSY